MQSFDKVAVSIFNPGRIVVGEKYNRIYLDHCVLLAGNILCSASMAFLSFRSKHCVRKAYH